MPRQPRSPASASPTGPPPITRTGTMSLPTCCDPTALDHMQRPAEKVKHARCSIRPRPAHCVPSPQRGEGQDEGVRKSEFLLRSPNPLTPTLSPLGRGSSLCQLLRTFMASTSVLAARLGARVFLRGIANGSRARESTVTSNAKPVRCKERAGVGPAFLSSVTSVSPDQSNKLKEAERRQTQGHQPPHLAMRRAPFWSAHACRRSTTALT